MSGSGEPVEIVGVERRRAIGIGERGMSIGPRLPRKGGASALECIHRVRFILAVGPQSGAGASI